MCRHTQLPNRFHKRVPHRNSNITPRITFRHLAELLEFFVCEIIWCRPDIQFEHFRAGLHFWQWDEDSPFEASANGGVELPGDICRSKNEDSAWVVANSLPQSLAIGKSGDALRGRYVHLDEKFGFNSP